MHEEDAGAGTCSEPAPNASVSGGGGGGKKGKAAKKAKKVKKGKKKEE